MRDEYALRYLTRLVKWSESKLSNEIGWLRRMSAYKFDGYQDFVGGERFVSALIRWLGQFKESDRDFAYDLLRKHVIFLSPLEIQHLVRRTVPAHLRPLLIQRVAKDLKIPPYDIWSTPENVAAFDRLVRRSLFIGLSDGARMDVFRRANVGTVNNEQVAVNYELSDAKLGSFIKELRKAEKNDSARFEMVFLIDDFLGSGTTLCRQNKEGEWKGKIQKFGEAIQTRCKECFSEDFQIVTHHYVATQSGLARAEAKLAEFSAATKNEFLSKKFFPLTAGLVLDDKTRFSSGKDAVLDKFLQDYYDPDVMSPSLWEGGCHVQNGFADCGLTIVLEHNTPNNSLATLWAESLADTPNHRMRPLFRRRQRHD